MMKKWLFIILLPFVLPSCIAIFGSYGYYGAENNKDNVFENKRDDLPAIIVPFFSGEIPDNQNIFISFPSLIGKQCGIGIFVVIPIPFCEAFEDNNPFSFYALSRIKPWDPIADTFMVFLKTQDGSIYEGKRNPLRPKGNGSFVFPVKIKDVGIKGTIVIEYKDIKKEIPFKYDRAWKFVIGDLQKEWVNVRF